jgi:DNA transformation protein
MTRFAAQTRSAPAARVERHVEIRELPNFGPKSQQMLEQAGIRSVQQLHKLGAVRAYLKVKRSGGNASLNLLWAMEGAITGRDWRVVARDDRLRLLLELEELESKT